MGKVGSLLVETHVMPDGWVVRYVSNGLGRDWMLKKEGEFGCLQLNIENKLKGILRDYIHRPEVVQGRRGIQVMIVLWMEFSGSK